MHDYLRRHQHLLSMLITSRHVHPLYCMSPFQCCLGYQPPLFSAQKEDVDIPSAPHFGQWTTDVVTSTGTLLQSTTTYKRQADHHGVKASKYCVGQSHPCYKRHPFEDILTQTLPLLHCSLYNYQDNQLMCRPFLACD